MSATLVTVHWNRRRIGMFVVGVIASAILIFPLADVWRHEGGSLTERIEMDLSPAEALVSKDFDQIVMLANGMEFVDRFGLSVGQQGTTSLLFFVPRSLWAGRSIDTGVLVGEWLVDNGIAPQPNLSAPLWLEGYVDFGIPGTIGIMFIFGVLCRHADEWFVRGESFRLVTSGSIIAPLLASYGFILLRGSLLATMSKLFVMVLCWAFLARRERSRASSVSQDAGSRISSLG